MSGYETHSRCWSTALGDILGAEQGRVTSLAADLVPQGLCVTVPTLASEKSFFFHFLPWTQERQALRRWPIGAAQFSELPPAGAGFGTWEWLQGLSWSQIFSGQADDFLLMLYSAFKHQASRLFTSCANHHSQRSHLDRAFHHGYFGHLQMSLWVEPNGLHLQSLWNGDRKTIFLIPSLPSNSLPLGKS